MDRHGRSAVEQALDRVIDGALIDPASVVATAWRLGLPLAGRDTTQRLASLRALPLSDLDLLADEIVRGYARIAGIQGFVTNLGGLVTLPVALPADAVATVTWVVRATSGVMAAYGFDPTSPGTRADLRLGLLVAFGVNKLTVAGSSMVVGEVSRRLLTAGYRDQVAVAVVRHLAHRLGLRIGRRQLARAVPLLGGVIGGGMNVAMVRAIGRRTRQHYRELLIDWRGAELAGQLPTPPGLPPPPAG